MLLAVAPGSADSRFEGVARLDTAELAILAATDNDDLPLVNARLEVRRSFPSGRSAAWSASAGS